MQNMSLQYFFLKATNGRYNYVCIISSEAIRDTRYLHSCMQFPWGLEHMVNYVNNIYIYIWTGNGTPCSVWT